MTSFKEIIQSDIPVLLDFHADWCAPCRTLGPFIKQAKQELGDQVKVIKIDVDRNSQLASSLKIRGVPTMMIYKNGELKWRQSGVLPPDAIVQTVRQYI